MKKIFYLSVAPTWPILSRVFSSHGTSTTSTWRSCSPFWIGILQIYPRNFQSSGSITCVNLDPSFHMLSVRLAESHFVPQVVKRKLHLTLKTPTRSVRHLRRFPSRAKLRAAAGEATVGRRTSSPSVPSHQNSPQKHSTIRAEF